MEFCYHHDLCQVSFAMHLNISEGSRIYLCSLLLERHLSGRVSLCGLVCFDDKCVGGLLSFIGCKEDDTAAGRAFLECCKASAFLTNDLWQDQGQGFFPPYLNIPGKANYFSRMASCQANNMQIMKKGT